MTGIGEVALLMTLLKQGLIIGGASIIGAEAWSIYLKNKRHVKEELGTSDLAHQEDFKNIIGDKGLRISKETRLSEKSCYEGLCVIAPTGGGKTTSLFVPNLLENNLSGSIVVIDPKGELYNLSAHYQRTVCGRKVILFNPLEPQISERYNLLENCKDSSEVAQLAQSLLYNGALSAELTTGKRGGGVEWLDMATPLLTAALHFVKDLGRPYNTIESAFRLVIDNKDLDLLFEGAKKEAKTNYNIFKSVGGAENTIGGIKITLATALKLFTDSKLNKVAGESTFKIEDLRKEKTIVYISYPERKAIYLAPFMACFFTQLIDKLLDSYSSNSLGINILADEFANIGLINGFSTTVSTCRSRKISICICLQGTTQLQQVYGEDNATTILNNLKTKLVLGSITDIKTLKYISELTGTKEIKNISSSTTDKNNTSKTYSYTTKQLFTPDEIRRLETTEVLIIAQNKKPLLNHLNTYYTNNNYNSNIKPTEPPINRYRIHDSESINLQLQKLLNDRFRSKQKQQEKEPIKINDLMAEIFGK